jgi:cytochrome bd ubiquinol oxidase subunit I
MDLDVVLLARLKFWMTVGFHYVFPTITIGLAWILFAFEAAGMKTGKPVYTQLGRFFGKLFGLTFAIGVASGLVMVFQFGTNWARYSRFVGDIFGAPLAAEAVFAFFMESTFLGLYLFARERVPRGTHVFSIFMVALGATISAFWIIVANSWQQTPAGFAIVLADGKTLSQAEFLAHPVDLTNARAVLTDFGAAIFNPSTMIRFFHTFISCLIAGAFFVGGIGAYYLLKNATDEFGRTAVRWAVAIGLVASLLQVFPSGHEHGRQMAATQPAKFAAIMGIYESQTAAPVMVFAVPYSKPPELKAPIQIPGILSWLAFGSIDARVQGLSDFPKDEWPPLFLTFVSYHNMVLLGMWFIFLMGLAAFQWRKGTLWNSRKTLKAMLWSLPLPVIASQLGWIAAEVGRQPWAVYRILKTSQSVSVTVGAGTVVLALVVFFVIYAALGYGYIRLLVAAIKKGPAATTAEGGHA